MGEYADIPIRIYLHDGEQAVNSCHPYSRNHIKYMKKYLFCIQDMV